MPGLGGSGTGGCLALVGCLVWGVLSPGGVWSGGCLVLGGAWSGGCLTPGGSGGDPPPRTATAADGMHPTGMHSC